MSQPQPYAATPASRFRLRPSRVLRTIREGKVARAAQWLAAQGLEFASAHTAFYTDSINDQALMERVHQPVATNPDERLRALAVQRGWPILELFGTTQ